MFSKNTVKSKIKILLITIIRKDPNLIPDIIKNPLLIPKERISKADALIINNTFEDSNNSNEILNQFKTSQLEVFAVKLQNLLNLYFTDDDLVAIEIEEINRSIPVPVRSLKFLPPNGYIIRNNEDNTFRIDYILRTRFIHRSNEIYATITISKHCNDDITETLMKHTLLDHIYNDRIYHFECRYCQKRFRITPSLLDFC